MFTQIRWVQSVSYCDLDIWKGTILFRTIVICNVHDVWNRQEVGKVLDDSKFITNKNEDFIRIEVIDSARLYCCIYLFLFSKLILTGVRKHFSQMYTQYV